MSSTSGRTPAPDTAPRPRPPGTPGRTPAIGRIALGYFALSAVALVAPVYTAVGNHIEPRVLGLPWSLVYVLGVVLANALVLATLYVGRWVDGRDGPEASEAVPEQPPQWGGRPS